MSEFRELLLHQKSENYGVEKALREVSLGQTPSFTGKGTEACYSLLCSLRLFTISPVPAVMASCFEPKKSERVRGFLLPALEGALGTPAVLPIL